MKSVRVRSYSGPYSVQMWVNTDQNNSKYGHFLHSVEFENDSLESSMSLKNENVSIESLTATKNIWVCKHHASSWEKILWRNDIFLEVEIGTNVWFYLCKNWIEIYLVKQNTCLR